MEKAKTTKTRIVNKAIELFQKEGYENVSVDRICEECGLTKGAFYNYFGRKIDVLPAFFYMNIVSDENLIVRLFREKDPLEQIWLVFEPTFELGVKMGAETMKYSWFYNIEHNNSISSSFMEKPGFGLTNKTTVIELIKNGQETGRLRNDMSAEDLFQLYYDTQCGISIRWVATGGNFDVIAEMRKALDKTMLT